MPWLSLVLAQEGPATSPNPPAPDPAAPAPAAPAGSDAGASGPPDEPGAEIVVTASRTEQRRDDATAPVTVLDRDAIVATGAATLEDALRAVPDLRVSSSKGGAAIALAGLDPEHTLILVDGRPLAGRVDGTVDVSRIPIEQIERVEILRGPASALYGSEALGGVVNVVTRREDVLGAEGRVRFGSRDLAELAVSASGSGGALSGGVSTDRTQQDGWDLDPSDDATTGDDLLLWGAGGWFRVAPSSRFGVEGDATYRQRDLVGVSATAAGAVFDTHALEESGEMALGANAWNGGRLTGNVRLAGSIWRQQYLEDQRYSSVQDAYEETWDRRLFLQAAGQWAPEGHLLVVGLDGALEGLVSDRIDGGVASRRRIALYAQEDWRVLQAPRLAVSPGARLDLDSQFGVHVTPNLALRLDPVPALSIRVTGGQGYRAPEFKELYLALDHASYGYRLYGNEDLVPESSTGGTLQAIGHARAIELRAEGWWNEVQNLIDPELVAEGTSDEAAQYRYENVGHAVTRGARAGGTWAGGPSAGGPSAGGTGAHRVVTLSADYVLSEARNRDEDVLLDGRPTHRATASVQVRVWTLDLATTLAWEGWRPYTTDEGTTWADPYLWADVRLGWRPVPACQVEVGARNLLEAQDNLYLGLPPRTLYAGVRAAVR